MVAPRPNPPFWSPQWLSDGLVRHAYVALVVLGLGVRAILRATQIDMAAPELWEFDDIAENLLETGVYSFRTPGVPTAYMPPAFPLLITGLYALLGVGAAAHTALAAILWLGDVVHCALVGWLAARLFGARAGLLAWSVALWWPNFVMWSGRLHDISIYTPLFVLAFGLLFVDRWSATRRAVAAGLVMGIFGLFRFEAAGFLIPFVLYLAFATPETRFSWAERTHGWGRRVVVVGLLVATFALPLLPWLVRTNAVWGRPMLSSVSGYALLRGHHEGATGSGRDPWPSNRGTPVPSSPEIDALRFEDPQDELTRDAWYRDYAVNYILENPLHELQLLGAKLLYFLVTDFTHPYARMPFVWIPSLIALLAGLAFFVRQGVRVPEQQVLWLVFLLQIGVVVLLFVLPRYRQMVDFVPVVFLAGWGAQLAMLRGLWNEALSEASSRTG